MRAVPFVAVALAAGAVVGALNAAKPSQPPSRLPDAVAAPAPAAPGAAGPKLYGADEAELAQFAHRPNMSCAAASCHGGGVPGQTGSEHHTWAPEADPNAAGDPHARAHRVLYNEVSVRMGELLGFDGSTKEKARPHENQKCLVCHAVPEAAARSAEPGQALAEGVGCAGCHGPADRWSAAHVAPGWKGLTNEQKWKEYGFVPTKNLVARALNCAGCHVGDEKRDMNHDMIAAGHPRLAFEPARFHATSNYRKHWAEPHARTDPGRAARDFEVRVWVVGQAATLRAAVNLLHARAERAAKAESAVAAGRGPDLAATPWPEFSGHSCYACHQKLADTDIRGAAGAGPRRPGVPGWEVWSNAAVEVARDTCGLAFPGVSSSELTAVADLRKLVDGRRAPDPAAVAAKARAARDELDRWLAQLQAAQDKGLPPVPADVPPAIAKRLAANALAADGKALADHDWDALASNYLGAASMYAATGGARGGLPWGDKVGRIGDKLRFPTRPEGGAFNSPADLDQKKLKQFRQDFAELFQGIRTAGNATEGK